MADTAQNGRAPEYIEEVDLKLENLDNDGLGEDVSDIDCDDEDELEDIIGDDMENPVDIRKSEGDDEDSDDDDDDDKVSKADDDDSDWDDEDKLKKEAKKGGLTAGNLQKSIANLARFVENQDPATRRANLFRRAQLGKSLTKSEQAEILSHFRSESEAPRRRLAKGLNQNGAVQRGIDHNEYLANQNLELVKALGAVDASLHETAKSGMEFNLMMAKAVAAIGQDLRRLSKGLDKVMGAPASAPKSVGVAGRARPLAKSQAAAPGLSYNEGQAAIQGLLAKSAEAGRYGQSSSGADLLKGSMHFESCGQIHPDIQADVQRYIRENR